MPFEYIINWLDVKNQLEWEGEVIMDRDSIKYLSNYISLTEEIKNKIEKHAKGYGIKAEICAWYQDWEDFCSDWCDDIGYNRAEARRLLHGGIGEFMFLSDYLGIVRFVI